MDLLDQISLGHVRVRGAREDAALTRLRTSHLLGTVRLQPHAMPPAAVLVVRSMADPLPGRIARELGAAATVSADWERAAQSRLGALYARAARPAWGAVSPSAEAVLFADYAELLACLANDLSSGATAGWWWQSILNRYSMQLPGSWTSLWQEQAQYIPSALEHLVSRNRAVGVLDRIAPVQAWRLLVATARAFDLPDSLFTRSWPRAFTRNAEELAEAAETTPQPLIGETQTSNSNVPRGAKAPVDFVDVPIRRQLPWEPHVAAEVTPASLGVERRALLGLGLLLSRAPFAAQSRRFADRFAAWLAAPEEAIVQIPPPQPDVLRRAAESPTCAPVRSGLEQGVGSQVEPLTHVGRPGVTDSPREPALTLPRKVSKDSIPRDWGAGVLTRMGGVLYLIHLLRKAELARHFDTGLGGWALLELLARCLLGRSFPAMAADPIWEVLAELDGRDPRVPPGLGFQPQPTYTAPDSWLRYLNADTRMARFRARGIELWTPEALVLDSTESMVAAAHSTVVRIPRRERRRLRRVAEVHPADLPLSPELRRFLHFVLPYARWCLGQVLRGIRLEDALSRRSKLIVSKCHIDLLMDMNQISVPVRLAGLDANPGWVPELGRIITFHFLPEGIGGD
jgi:hypothetical protein